VDQPDFKLVATGFDPHRDLIVDVRPLHDASSEDSTPAVLEETEDTAI
jgi:hypothetical protein